ncbi:hypothetical protein B0O99DRAFT_348491 [Bisporella sp. PMI_857]|nr:hypothetical protein B0O99DRAFT_348491 [Bisporella sp. PMI_857]
MAQNPARQWEQRAQNKYPGSETFRVEQRNSLANNGKQQEAYDERRRQLNRRAQKAFRERRTERMADLEISIEQMKKELDASQAARSRATEELMMVKYKNSLLERLLLEKGIDVHKELQNPQPGRYGKGTKRNRATVDDEGEVPRKQRKRTFENSGIPHSYQHALEFQNNIFQIRDPDSAISAQASAYNRATIDTQTCPASQDATLPESSPGARRRLSHRSNRYVSSPVAPSHRRYPEPDVHDKIPTQQNPYPSPPSTYRADDLPSAVNLDPPRKSPTILETNALPVASTAPPSRSRRFRALPPFMYDCNDFEVIGGDNRSGAEMGNCSFLDDRSLLVGDPFGLDDILNFPSQF